VCVYHVVESSQYMDVHLWNHYHGNECFREAKLCVIWLDTCMSVKVQVAGVQLDLPVDLGEVLFDCCRYMSI
jgi:hypothetical protein